MLLALYLVSRLLCEILPCSAFLFHCYYRFHMTQLSLIGLDFVDLAAGLSSAIS